MYDAIKNGQLHFELPDLRVDVNECPLNLNCNLMCLQQVNFNISFCNNSILAVYIFIYV